MASSPDRTHYDVLGIARDADASAVRSAWKLHVQAWHPDRFSGEMREHAEVQTSRINEAYTTLRDSSRRAAYDCRLAADEADAVRAEAPAPRRRSTAARTQPHRHAATPVGTPMAVAAAPMTLSEQVAEAVQDAGSLMRQHPRITAAVVVTTLVVFAVSAGMYFLSGPSLPASVDADRPARPAVAHVGQEQTEELASLAEQARRESRLADQQMQEMMQQDAAAEAEAQAQEAARAAAAAKAARASKGSGAAGQRAPALPSGRVVRVMPNVQ